MTGAAGLLLICAGAAEAAEYDFEPTVRVAVAGGVVDADGAESPEPVAARVDVGGTARVTLDSGLRLGATLEAGAELDQAGRDARGGRAGDCPAGVADCAGVRSPITGYFAAGLGEDREARGALTRAYVFLEGGWGEVSLGRDDGAAARFSLPTPSVLTRTSLADASLSVTGLAEIVTANDLSGSSTKITLASPRLLGLRAGLSFAPESDAVDLDRGFDQRSGAAASLDAENIVEAGLSFARTWRNGLRTEAAVTYLTAEDGSGLTGFDRVESWHAGLRLARGDWRVGAAYLASDNGWAAGDRGYEGLSVGAVYDRGGAWAWMLEGAAGSDNLLHVDVSGVTAAARYALDDRTDISFGARYETRDSPVVIGGVRGGVEESAAGLFLEIASDL
jgi:predicted porin